MFHKLNPANYEEFVEQFRAAPPDANAPDNFNFAYDVVDSIAAQDPGRLAMVHVDDEGKRREFDFGHFSKRSHQLAGALKDLGVRPGDKVMLVLYRRVEYWEAMLALHRLGALPIPSPSLLTAHDIEQRAAYANIKTVICEDTFTPRVGGAHPNCPSFEHLIQVGPTPLPEGWLSYESLLASGPETFERTADSPGGADPMVIFFTSGTTGLPKMVVHDYNYPLGHYATGAYWHDLEPGDLHLTLSDTGWAKSVWGKFYGQWMAEAAVFVWDFRGKFEPAELLEMIARHRVTTFCAPPTVYRFLIRQDLSKFDLSALRHCTTAGELLNESVFTTWKEATGLPIYEGYGQTETCLQIATFTCMEPKPGSIGRACPGWDLALLDTEGNPCPPGEEGEICVRMNGSGDNNGVLGLFNGYMDEPEKTAAVKVGEYYHTGDKAWMDEDGYYWFLGRNDDLIKSSGYRIGPFEVESALITHPAVVEAAVTGVPDPVRTVAVKATLVLAPEYEPSDELTKEIQNHVKTVTAPYKYPRVIEYVDELPKTISGKIKRAEIRKRDKEKYG